MTIFKTHIFFLFLFFTTKVFTQDTLNSAIVEQKSYQLYLDQNWPKLCNFGNKAIHKGFDYFYLQMRIGIAFYERKNYSLAEGHFKRAIAFNSGDDLALEYLYYCYLFNGRYEEATKLSIKFSRELAEKIGTNKTSSIGFIMLEGGTKVSDSASYYDVYTKTNSTYYDPALYFQFGINHYVKKKASLFHAVTYYNQKNSFGTITQYQYFLKSAIPLKNNFLLLPTFHYVGLTSSTETITTVTVKQPPPPPGFPPPPAALTYTTLNTKQTQSNYFVGSVAIQKIVKKLTFSLGTTVSNINNVTQFIHSGFVSYSVFGNSNLVLGCTGYLHSNDTYATTNSAVTPFIYVQPFKVLAIKAGYFLNNKHNIVEDNGYLVNNSPDLTTSRWMLVVNFTLSKRISLYGLYQLENKLQNSQQFKYKYNVFVVGLKITP